jgi:hypothetical protein
MNRCPVSWFLFRPSVVADTDDIPPGHAAIVPALEIQTVGQGGWRTVRPDGGPARSDVLSARLIHWGM